MLLKEARALRPGDRVVCVSDCTFVAGVMDYREGEAFVIHSNDQAGPVKAARWLTFHKEGDRVPGNHGLSCHSMAKHFGLILQQPPQEATSMDDDPRSPSEHAMGCRYAHERNDGLDDGRPAYPITDLRADKVLGILAEATDEDAALVVRALNAHEAARLTRDHLGAALALLKDIQASLKAARVPPPSSLDGQVRAIERHLAEG